MYDTPLAFPALTSAMTPLQNDHSDATCDTTDSLANTKKTKDTAKTSMKSKGPMSSNAEDLKSPGLSYIALISMAIQSSPEKKMLLSEIYQWISDRHPYYQLKDKSWRNSIRHNLSLNECFLKSGRSENGKGNYWSIHPANIDDFSKGDYRRRRARRRVRKCDDDLQRLCSDVPEIDTPLSPPQLLNGTQDGYVPMISTLVPSNFLSVLGVEPIKSYDYWMANQYTQTDLSHRTTQVQLHESRDNKCDSGCSDVTCRENQLYRQYVPYFGRVNDSDNYSTVAYPESTFNVNVNVNVCENRGQQGSSSQCDSSPCGSHVNQVKLWNDTHT